MTLRIIGGILGIVFLCMIVWDFVGPQELLEYFIAPLAFAFALILYAIGGKKLLKKVFPFLVEKTLPWLGHKDDPPQSKK